MRVWPVRARLAIVSNTVNWYLGTIPDYICQLTNLQSLYLTTNGSNAGLTCAPLCVSTVLTHHVPSNICVYPQDNGLCGLIAATNIHNISGYSQWSCSTAGYTSSTPCLFPVWNGLTCSGIDVISISLTHLKLSGMLWLLMRQLEWVCWVFEGIV